MQESVRLLHATLRKPPRLQTNAAAKEENLYKDASLNATIAWKL